MALFLLWIKVEPTGECVRVEAGRRGFLSLVMLRFSVPVLMLKMKVKLTGTWVPVVQVKAGDQVLYFKYAGDNMETPSGEKYIVLHESDILCKT
jgi:hypothetical protein